MIRAVNSVNKTTSKTGIFKAKLGNLHSFTMQSIADQNLNYTSDVLWPKEFPELKMIDDAMKCGICYDYIKICMVTPCAHSYCSICIRRSLQYKTACPTCFEETFESTLRNNRILDRVIDLFSSIKEKLVKHLKIAAVQFSSIEKLASPATPQNVSSIKCTTLDSTPKRNLQKKSQSSIKNKLKFSSTAEDRLKQRTISKSDISRRLEDILVSPPTAGTSKNNSIPSPHLSSPGLTSVPPMFLQTKSDVQAKPASTPVVPCPVCRVDIPEKNINFHLDNCLANASKPPIKKRPVEMKQKRAPLTKMVWTLMGEKDLRKKLKDYGLNTQGDKKMLISRIQKYILLYNSECDNDNPRPVAELIRQVEKEEKQTIPQTFQRLFANKKTDPKVSEAENNKYIKENKESFKKLIEAMKEREGRNIKPLSHSACRIYSDDEDDVDSRTCSGAENCVDKRAMSEVSKDNVEEVNLCDSNSSEGKYSPMSSPVLGNSSFVNKKLSNGNASNSSSGGSTPARLSTKTSNLDLDQLCSMLEVENNSDNSPVLSRQSSPNLLQSRTPSPSLFEPNQSNDSGDSISLLTDHNKGTENVLTQVLTECIPYEERQLEESDYVIDTDQGEHNSDELFAPQKRTKRKRKTVVLAEPKLNPSPRRTRQRCNK